MTQIESGVNAGRREAVVTANYERVIHLQGLRETLA
jgi:hypothetical protein